MERNIYIYIYLYYFYTLRKKRDEFKVMNKSVILEGSKVKLYNCMFFNWNFLSISTQFGQKWKCGPSWFIFFPISLPFYLSNSENPTFFFFSLLFSPHFPFSNAMSNRIRKCKSFLLFYTKNLLFLYYTPIFTKHPRYPIYSAHLFNKIFILLQFFIISSLTAPLSHMPNTTQKNTKILYTQVTVTMHICKVTQYYPKKNIQVLQ